MTSQTDIGDEASGPGLPGDLAFQGTTWWLLAGAGKLALRRWSALLAQLELTPSQYKLLLALDESGPLGQQRLAELVGIDPRNAVPIIETSVERGLLIRNVDPADRRRRVLELAPAGSRVATQLRSLSAELEDELLGPLTQAERGTLRKMLHALLDATDPPS